MNCIFITVFNQLKYIEMFFLLLESIFIYGELDDNTNILVYTSTQFMNIIKQSRLFNDEKIKFEINDTYDDIDKSCKARLDLFILSSIINYNKILYLDTDILIKDNINKVFDVCKEEVLYVLEEGEIDSDTDFWGKTLFGNKINNYNDKSAFTSGILLFNNCEKIKELFININKDIIKRPHIFSCYDQPYIVYNAFKYNLYNNKILKSFVVNNDNNIFSDKVIHHFPGGPGNYHHKIDYMTIFLNNITYHKNEIITNHVKTFTINVSVGPPVKNTTLSLIGLCVSYNYMDTLKFMLPVNYLHFEKIYLITQIDDEETINFCKQFDNVVVLFYKFKCNNKNFDKYGALNYAQKIAYTDYSDSWYLIIDSDIILPNNLIDILDKENLNPECIYTAWRNNVFKSSELLNKYQIVNNKENLNWVYNNILFLKETHPPSLMGCFQLYKKHVYHRNNLNDSGYGDYYFGYDNFKLFCNLDNILIFHLGESGKNWYGKIVSFIDDIKISLNDIYYTCHKKINSIYYNEKCQLVKYGNSKNIDNDIWTCSDKMRYDIYDFFKDKLHFKIAEIGSHKGYSTRVLSNIFSKVYAVDNNLEWTEFNKNFNKDVTNIEYVMLDIYNNTWEVLPDDIEVSFIDAGHSYECCKSDIFNSIKQFEKLQYIIFDDYGVWSGVRQIVDELIHNKILIFEKFIGINNVPGPNGIVKNVNEGIICRINKFVKNDLENKTIIISRYNENLEWINEYPFNQFQYIVYNKGINDNFCKNNVKQIIYLPNIGRESHTYLYHIINNYDNLSNILIFFPGSLNLNYKKEKAIKILNNIFFSNHTNAYFVGNYQNDIFESFKDFKLDNWKCSNLQNLKLNPESELQLCRLRPYGKWYRYFFGNIKARWNTYCGIFSVDKRDIIQHPKIRYEMLLNTVSNSSNPESNYYMERSWGAIFYPMIHTKKILE